MRGFAYEELNNVKMAKHDYTAGMLAYDELARELGPDVASRMTNNVAFMEARKRALPEVPRKSLSVHLKISMLTR